MFQFALVQWHFEKFAVLCLANINFNSLEMLTFCEISFQVLKSGILIGWFFFVHSIIRLWGIQPMVASLEIEGPLLHFFSSYFHPIRNDFSKFSKKLQKFQFGKKVRPSKLKLSDCKLSRTRLLVYKVKPWRFRLPLNPYRIVFGKRKSWKTLNFEPCHRSIVKI